MSALLFLCSDDFNIQQGSNGNILCTSIPELSLVLFYSTACKHCHTLLPIFKTLPGTIEGCQFGMINVSNNRKCVELSKDTIAPVTYVPYIILYVHGKPFMKYNGPHDASEMRRFIIEVANKINSKQEFSQKTSQHIKINKKKIPEYTIGMPKCDEDICYLEFDEAYIKNK